MIVQKIKHFDLLCQHCGAKISLSYDEFKQYAEAIEGYGGSTVICQREGEDKKNHDISYVNFDCPVCGGYIPTVVSDNDVDADEWGFVYSKNCKPVYAPSETINMGEYIDNWFGKDGESDIEDSDSELDKNSKI